MDDNRKFFSASFNQNCFRFELQYVIAANFVLGENPSLPIAAGRLKMALLRLHDRGLKVSSQSSLKLTKTVTLIVSPK